MHRVSGLHAARLLFFVVLIVIQAHLAFAQARVDPNVIEFDPSPDHAALATDGKPLVDEYLMSVYVAGETTLIKTISLGKPPVMADGKIRVDFLSVLSSI